MKILWHYVSHMLIGLKYGLISYGIYATYICFGQWSPTTEYSERWVTIFGRDRDVATLLQAGYAIPIFFLLFGLVLGRLIQTDLHQSKFAVAKTVIAILAAGLYCQAAFHLSFAWN
jgi:hypothetical protein